MSSVWGPRAGRAKQLTFADRRRRDGKRRKKPGPKPAERSSVAHEERAGHSKWIPLHITLRGKEGLPSFRSLVAYAAFEESIRRTRRPDFRIVEFSVQTNHLHLIVEADSNDALARGMKSFSNSANRRFNIAIGRGRGQVWADRFHCEKLTTPRQVRNALLYCLQNYKKHEGQTAGRRCIDFCSSARWFTGWNAPRSANTNDDGPRPTPLPTTPLLAGLWQRHGLLDPAEAPKRRAS